MSVGVSAGSKSTTSSTQIDTAVQKLVHQMGALNDPYSLALPKPSLGPINWDALNSALMGSVVGHMVNRVMK